MSGKINTLLTIIFILGFVWTFCTIGLILGFIDYARMTR